MTLRDKVKEVEPDDVDDDYIGGVYGCPYEYDYLEERYSKYCKLLTCDECWSQEYIEKVNE